MIFLIILLISLLILFTWRCSRKPEKFPPGPKWIPVLGCIPVISHLLNKLKFHHIVWQYLISRYGSIVGLKVGRDLLIIVSGKENIKEFYSREEFNGRPKGYFFRIRSFGKRLGIVFTDGQDFIILKRFCLKILKQLGNGKFGMLTHLENEAKEMVNNFKIKAENNELINMEYAFDASILNVMWALLAGYRFDLNDEHLQQLIKLIHESFRIIDMSGGILNQFPFIRYIFPKSSGYKKLIETLTPLWIFLKNAINDIKININLKKQPQSLFEAFLLEIEQNTENSKIFNEEQLLSLGLDFFQASSETTSNVLGFGMIYMLRYPNVLEKVRNELKCVIGENRLPCLADKINLNYTDAVISEIQRISNVAPLAIAHRCKKNTEFNGYLIPKDTIALISLYSLNMDVKYWKDPQVFRPERFLDENGKRIQHDTFIPFGLGKRRCIGENLAKSTLFLFFSTFVHVFDIILPNSKELPSEEGLDGITLSPKPYQATLKLRNFVNFLK